MPAATALFAQSAPDFWHWRAATFDFTGPKSERIARGDKLVSQVEAQRLALPREERRQQITELHEQLKQAEQAEDEESPRSIERRWRFLNKLSLTHSEQGEFDRAETCAEQALELARKIDEQTEAVGLTNLAQLLQDTNRLSEAEPLMRRALSIDEQAYGPDHPEVAIDLNNLAGLLQDTNRLSEAEPLMRRALSIDDQSFGPDHPDVAIRLNNLAMLLQNTNRLSEAELPSRKSLEILVAFEKVTGHEHPRRMKFQANYRLLLKELDLTEAEIEERVKEERVKKVLQ